MKYASMAAAGLVVVLVALLATGCGGARSKAAYGRAIPPDMAVTTAAEILANPAAFEGKDVLVQGKVTSECPSGGWIWLRDGSGDIYVNMHPTNVFIPQRVGSDVQALGRVVVESGSPQVVGYGLKF